MEQCSNVVYVVLSGRRSSYVLYIDLFLIKLSNFEIGTGPDDFTRRFHAIENVNVMGDGDKR